jgi:hypothetical protein
VHFSLALTADQAMAVLAATEKAQTVTDLELSLRELGKVWGVAVATEIVSRKSTGS